MTTPPDPYGPPQPPSDSWGGQPQYGQYPQQDQGAPQSPYGQAPYDQGPYAQAPYGQGAFGGPAPYAQPPYTQPPYTQPPYGQAPYAQPPYAQPPYQGNPGFAPAVDPQKPGMRKRIAAAVSVAAVVTVGITVRFAVRSLFDGVGSPAAASSSAASTGAGTAGYAVGDCMDLQGSVLVTDTKVACTGSGADYKVLAVIPGVSGDIGTDAQRCYTVSGNDEEIDKSAAGGEQYLYCLGSTTGKHSPRRAQQGDCLDVPADSQDYYLVDCSDPSADYKVLARFDGTGDESKCDPVAGTTETFTLSSDPQVLLCGKPV